MMCRQIKNCSPALLQQGDILMTTSTETVLNQALQLSLNDRVVLVDSLIASINQPDPSLDALWLKEAEDRLAAYHSGEIKAVDAEQVFAELGKQV